MITFLYDMKIIMLSKNTTFLVLFNIEIVKIVENFFSFGINAYLLVGSLQTIWVA